MSSMQSDLFCTLHHERFDMPSLFRSSDQKTIFMVNTVNKGAYLQTCLTEILPVEILNLI